MSFYVGDAFQITQAHRIFTPEACQPFLGIPYHASATAAGPRDGRCDDIDI